MKSNRGIGIIKLLIMIIFIVLIVAGGIYFVRMKYYEAKVETIQTDMLKVQWKLKDYIDQQTVKGEEKKYLGTKLSEMKEDIILKSFFECSILTEEEYDKYYALTDEDLEEARLEITNYADSYFIINYETYEVLVSKGCDFGNSEVLYKLTDIINKQSKEEKMDNKEENIAEQEMEEEASEE